jgi:acetyl-CoA decarbonylase/synthase complex subunit gamma
VPTRAFAAKGWLVIIPVFILMFVLFPEYFSLTLVEKISWFFIMSAISSFFAMNFTGASTFTSLSGVKKEMKYAVPIQIVGFVAGFVGWLLKRFI